MVQAPSLLSAPLATGTVEEHAGDLPKEPLSDRYGSPTVKEQEPF